MGLRVRSGPIGSLALQSLGLGGNPGEVVSASQIPLMVGGAIETTRILDGRINIFFPGGGVAVSPDGRWNCNVVTVTDGVAFTINAISSVALLAGLNLSELFRLVIKNASGGIMGAITFPASIHLAGAFVNPLNGFNRTLTLQYDGVNWLEIGRSLADVAN